MATRPNLFLVIMCLAVFLVSCNQPTPQAEGFDENETDVAGFEAVITGSYEGHTVVPVALAIR